MGEVVTMGGTAGELIPSELYHHGSLFALVRSVFVFINMVISRFKNGSPDIILTAFDRNFDEKKDEIPPGICRLHLLQNFQY